MAPGLRDVIIGFASYWL